MVESGALDDRWISLFVKGVTGRETSGANSLDAYRSDLAAFLRQADDETREAARNRRILPAALGRWIGGMTKSGLAYSTIRRRVSALASIDRAWRLEDGMLDKDIADVRTPQVAKMLDKARNRVAARTMRRFVVFRGGMNQMVDALDRAYKGEKALGRREELQYLRDRALILALYAGPLTRTEAGTLHVDDTGHEKGRFFAHVSPAGEEYDELTRRMVWRKPDTVRRIEFEPDLDVRYDVDFAVQRWLHASGIGTGYLFASIPAECQFKTDEDGQVIGEALHPKHLRQIVGRAAASAGLPVEAIHDADGPQPGRGKPKVFGGVTVRSLRAGAVGDRVKAGESVGDVIGRVGLTALQDGLAEAVSAREGMHERLPVLTVLARKSR